MKEMPVNDFMTKNGKIREDGRTLRDMYVFRVKSPAESKGEWDIYSEVATIPASEAFALRRPEGLLSRQRITRAGGQLANDTSGASWLHNPALTGRDRARKAAGR
jgi:hypothetical protein